MQKQKLSTPELVEWLAEHPRERNLLLLIDRHLATRQPVPTYEAIVEAMGLVALNQVYRSVLKLRGLGLLPESRGHVPNLYPTSAGNQVIEQLHNKGYVFHRDGKGKR